jgi:hypothetical protein
MHNPLIIALFCGLGLARAASADITLDYLVSDTGAKADKTQALIVKDGKALVKGVGGDGNLDFIYSASPEFVLIIDHGKRSVMALDEKQVDRLVKQSDTVQPLIQGVAGQIAKLNPEQRAKWGEMLGGKVSLDKLAVATKPVPKSAAVKTGKMRKVADVSCEQINILQGKTKTAEFCLAEPANLKLSAADYFTLRTLISFADRLAKKTQVLAYQFGVNIPQIEIGVLPGFPIELRDLSGHDHNSLKLNRVDASSVSEDLMRIPEGYQTEPFKLWK